MAKKPGRGGEMGGISFHKTKNKCKKRGLSRHGTKARNYNEK